MPARNRAHLRARLKAFRDDRCLRRVRPAAPARGAFQDLKTACLAASRSQQMLHRLFQSFAPNRRAKLAQTSSPGKLLSTWGARSAYDASGLETANVVHRPRLLSDNGPSYISGDLAEYLADKGMKHTRGAPYHPQTQGKIERWHQTLKNRILLENYFLPGDLEAQIDAFVAHYNHQRYHESLKNLTPADVYTGRGQTILLEREKIKRRTMKLRRLQHAQSAA